MKAQNVVVGVAGVLTGLFLAAVGVVLVWPHMQARQEPRQAEFVLNVNNVNPGEIEAFPGEFPEPPGFPVAENPQPLPAEQVDRVRGHAVPSKEYTISGPHTSGNLSVFLIHGPDAMKKTTVVTLQEALANGTATVHDLGQLRIDNRGNAPLFIQAGDIVKGGTQDRTLPSDMLVPAHSNRIPIAALCVEQGRSFPRGNELSTAFSTSNEQLPTRLLKLAALRNSQLDVWNNVRSLQTALTRSVGASVQAQQSQTSLQLTLEHPRVLNAVQDHLMKLDRLPQDKDDVIGYAVAVNGKIASADVYGSNALFEKLWPKQIRSAAVEALAERRQGVGAGALTAADVQEFIAEAEKGQAFRAGGNRTVAIRHDGPRHLLVDTCDPAQDNVVLHRLVLAK